MRFTIHTDCKNCGCMIKNTRERRKLYDIFVIPDRLCMDCINTKNWKYRK